MTEQPTNPVYEAAGTGRRLRQWRVPMTGPNAGARSGKQAIVNRSRAANRNDSWVGTAADKLVSNMVGTGVQAKCKNGTKEQKLERKKLWDAFMKTCDADGILDGYGMQALAVREWEEAGEVFARLRKRRPEDGLPVPLQIQMIEAEQCPCDLWQTASNGNAIRAGIEFNKIGQRVAYWMYRQHPGEQDVTFTGQELVRVPAEEVIHLYQPARTGEIRGMPRGSSTLVKSFNLDNLDDAVRMRQTMANMFTGYYVRKATDSTDAIGPLGQIAASQGDTDTDDTPLAGLEPGTMQELPPGMEVVFSNPPDAGSNYPAYYRLSLLAIAARHGVPYEVLTGDLTNVSDRSLRLILNEFRRMIEQRQWLYLIPKWCQPIREAFFDAALLDGKLDMPGYADDREYYVDTQWVPQGWPWSHPVQDVDAERKAVRAGFKSRSSVVLASGEDPEEVDEQIQQDNDRADEAGFIFDSDPRHVANNGASQSKAPTNSTDEATNAE